MYLPGAKADVMVVIAGEHIGSPLRNDGMVVHRKPLHPARAHAMMVYNHNNFAFNLTPGPAPLAERGGAAAPG